MHSRQWTCSPQSLRPPSHQPPQGLMDVSREEGKSFSDLSADRWPELTLSWKLADAARLARESPPGNLPDPGIKPMSLALAGRFLTNELLEVKRSEVAQSYLTLCDPMDCSLPSSSVHGIFQARVLEWIAISFSSGSSRPRDRTPGLPHCRQTLYRLSHMYVYLYKSIYTSVSFCMDILACICAYGQIDM